MFEQFTDRSRRVLVRAQKEAVEARHFIGGEHVLIALADADGGLASAALGEAGVTVDELRDAAARIHPPGPEISTSDALASIGIDADAVERTVKDAHPGVPINVPNSQRPPFSVEGKKILETALLQKVELEAEHLGTEHLLLGLLATPNAGRSVLEELAVDVDELAATVRTMASGSTEA